MNYETKDHMDCQVTQSLTQNAHGCVVIGTKSWPDPVTLREKQVK